MSEERLQKILSQAGVASRRASEQLMLDGRVTVNGATVRELGTKADAARDDIRVDGRRVKVPERHRYILLNKPPGYVTTRSDPHQRPTVIDLLADVRDYVYPVGRLDFDTEGLLILTNDGELAARLTHPRHGVARVYEARVLGVPDAHDITRLAKGIRHRGPAHAAGAREGAARAQRRGHAGNHRARRPEPPGPEHVRGDRPSGLVAAARGDWTDSGSEAAARTLERSGRSRGGAAAGGRQHTRRQTRT